MAAPAEEVGTSTATGPGPPEVVAAGGAVPPTGVVGLGDIGRGLAGTLRQAGVDLTVCDVRPEAAEAFRDGARITGSPAEMAAHCDVVLVAVVDDAQVRSVVAGPAGLLSAGRRGGTVVVVSTVTTDTVAAVAAEAAQHGVDVVDCGVSGGPGAAAEGQLVCMVGGAPEAVERVRPVLDVVGSLVLHMGPLGAGLSAKLARNLVQYGSWLAAYEAQLLAEAAGIPLALLAQAIRESDKRIGGAATLMFRETVQPLRADRPGDAGLIAPMAAASRLAHKDLRAALSLASTLGVELPLAHLTDECCDGLFGVAGIGADADADSGGAATEATGAGGSGGVAETGGMPR